MNKQRCNDIMKIYEMIICHTPSEIFKSNVSLINQRWTFCGKFNNDTDPIFKLFSHRREMELPTRLLYHNGYSMKTRYFYIKDAI